MVSGIYISTGTIDIEGLVQTEIQVPCLLPLLTQLEERGGEKERRRKQWEAEAPKRRAERLRRALQEKEEDERLELELYWQQYYADDSWQDAAYELWNSALNLLCHYTDDEHEQKKYEAMLLMH